ncbi:MAG: AAA family ATPase [Gemmatimonadota bacterium]|nr:AAA family ATPase [Gemmatimonadota bacterium]MDE2864991.1 AAA family ATPase [Gemmatimonadota bacterium]
MLTAIRLKDPPVSERDTFPFSIPALRGLREMALPGPVTFLAGENGSGKSTLLEALAIATNLPTVGGTDAASDDSLASQRLLAKRMVAVWSKRTHRGFFMRAEDFFGFIQRLGTLRVQMEARLDEVDRQYQGRSELARTLAKGPAAGSLADMRSRYGDDLDANSHGESFLRLFRSRFVPEGLYLLDEPEAALSPQSQLGFVAMMSDMVGQGAQFVIATHSPVLMAVPGATIYSFDSLPLREVSYDALDGVGLFRDFLRAPERYMRRLWSGPS